MICAWGDCSNVAHALLLSTDHNGCADFVFCDCRDMLMFANPRSKLTPAEGASHLGLWAILKAPLLLSTSIANLTGTCCALVSATRVHSQRDGYVVALTELWAFLE